MTAPIAAYTLDARGVRKRFGGTQALDDAGLRLRPGTIHALLGGNGSGKSTMIKCLAGVHRADDGEVDILGHSMRACDITPAEVHRAGLRVVHQDLGLFDRASIAENFAFESGFPTTPARTIAWRELNRQVSRILELHRIPARPSDLVGSLRPAQKTLVAIARALRDQHRGEMVLLLDEPTASLPERESALLFAALRERAEHGQAIALVTHRLSEALTVADDITVFRDGRVAGTLPAAAADHDRLVSLLAGPAGTPEAVHDPPAGSVHGGSLLDVRSVSAGPLRDLDLTVRAGEIVGIAGLLGSGRSTLLNVIFGGVEPVSGTVLLDGVALRPGDIAGAMARGVALVPENRLRDAAFTTMSVSENASVTVLGRLWRLWMRNRRERQEAEALVRRYAVKTHDVGQPFLQLSGGNQQKVVLARWLRRDPRLLLLDEPTQGVDVVARTEIYNAIRDAASRGCAVVVVSSDHDELATLCDQVVVLSGGKAVARIPRAMLTPDTITRQVQPVRKPLESTS
ncbi:sugar ABC transporter ATP-binding protein [Nonomuraea monospora]|uniref:Sugar ABC transporter ATP-binding protein n=1 Tax=Nonomuraea monospora TaxID=568818 RepID=A0ABN3D3X5_9ACTN